MGPVVGFNRIDTDDDFAAFVVQRFERVTNQNTGRILFCRRNSVLQVEDDAVGAQNVTVHQQVWSVARDK